ncbi:MFS transporter [Patescibacteria group bacterium]|nr:MFS transporter [Patescibacteria group bacterium]
MIAAIIARWNRETSHFRAMPETARLLSLSYFLRSAAYPLIGVFTGAYIWQTNNNVTLLILYYIGNFLALPVVFIFNKWLLSRIRMNTLYAIGTVLTGLSAIMVVFYQPDTPVTYLYYGFLYGFGNGIYWANRNFLTLRHTESAFRSYFTGLQFSLSTIASIVIPVLAGWFIVLTHTGYEILVITGFSLLLIAGLIIRKGSFSPPELREKHARALSPIWQKARLLSVAIGCVDSAIYILPTVLVLQSLGNEGVLGTVTSITAMLTAAVSYILGRKYRQSQYFRVFTGVLLCFILAGAPLIAGFSTFSVIWYLLIASLSDSLVWIANEPVIMDMQDDEVKRSHTTHYRLIIDREWFINMGRVSALIIFLVLARINQDMALRLTASVTGFLALCFTIPVLRKGKLSAI